MAQRFPIGMVYTMALDPSAVFALYAPGPTNGRPDQAQTKLARIDRNRGALVTAGPFPDAVDLARAGAGLWIAAGPGPYNAPAPPSTQWLTLVDPVTLRVERQVHLPGQPGSDLTIGPRLAGNGSLLWLGYGTHAYRLNPATGSTLLTLNLSGTATSLSLDPTGQRLYLGVDASTNGSGQALVIEVDASTGATLASAQTGGAGLGGPHVAAAADSVWVSYATGMMGAVEHRTATNLSSLPIAGGDPTEDLLRGTNGIKAIVGGGPLWLLDEMVQRLTCADPGTGATRASAQEISVSAFVADSGGAYLGDGDGVATLQPDPSCGH